MNKNSFFELLERPEGFDELQIKRLEEIVNEFEYFNTARILLLKAYHDKEHFAFNDLLSKTSLASQNREKLFELIHNNNLPFVQHNHANEANNITTVAEVQQITDLPEIGRAHV